MPRIASSSPTPPSSTQAPLVSRNSVLATTARVIEKPRKRAALPSEASKSKAPKMPTTGELVVSTKVVAAVLAEADQAPQRIARKVKRPDRFNDSPETVPSASAAAAAAPAPATFCATPVVAAPAPSIVVATAADSDAASSTTSERSSPVTVCTPETPAALCATPDAQKRPTRELQSQEKPTSCSTGGSAIELEMFDFDLEADSSFASGRVWDAPEILPEANTKLDSACQLVYEKTEEEVMLDILRGFEDEIGPDLRAVWDAAGKAEPIESSLLWDVVATPAMMRQFSQTVANGPSTASVEE